MAGKRRAEGPPSTARPSKDEKEPKTTKQRVLKVLKWTGITFLVLALIAVGGFIILYRSIDIPDPNSDFQTEASHIYYADGKTELGKFATQNRDIVGYDEMAQDVKDAVVAAENQSFWTDKGIDPKGILRAAFSNAQGNSTQGASTITQQYVKILYLTQEQSYKRKVKEAILSLKIQRQQSKEEILTGYLNTIYFGRGAYGVEAAAQAFFDTTAKKLNLRESAVLASVLNNPTNFDPANGHDAKKALKERYDYTLDNMAKLGNITEEESEKAQKRLPPFPEQETEDTYGGQKGHMLEMIRNELNRLGFTDEEIDGGGLQVTTTFTKKAMDAAEEGVLAGKPEGFGDKQLHIGAASVEPGTGAVRGFYAGQDYLDSQLNWALAGGQAGSTFKPFALATGLKQGYSLKSTFEGNSPIEVGDAEIENQGDTDYGSAVSLLKATEDSINTAYIDLTLALENGPEDIIETANDMGVPPEKGKAPMRGFPAHTPGLEPQTGVSLGSQTVSPINMANGYATIANGGVAAEPFIIQSVVNADGEKEYTHKVKTHQAIGEDVAADVSYAMQQVVATGSGTAALGLGRPAAGKTGTATKTGGAVSSSWFAGFTPQMATAVMYVRGVGNGQLDGWLPSYFGGDYPAETWTEIMTREMEGLEVEEFPEPANLEERDPPSEDHAPYTPPPPPKTTKKPETSKPPTSEPPPSEPPSSEPPPTSPPPTSDPTDDCEFLGNCPTDPTSPSNPGGGNNGGGNGGGGGGNGRELATRETVGVRRG
ncbi:MAG TPA: transglycosylase domain-containing protein [Nocardioides sp.]|nr:transglycosylase domain-containing protein [Nocardioides sp.]